MADEAVLRIVVQDDGSSTPSTTPSSPPPQPNQPNRPTPPVVPTGATRQPPPVNISGQPPAAPDDGSAEPIGPQPPTTPVETGRYRPPTQPFDPVEVAKRRIEREDQQAAVDAEYAKLRPPQPPKPPEPFDPVEAAKKRIEREDQQAAIEAEYAKLRPPPPTPPFDPTDAAKKRIEREKQQALVDAEYARLNPPPPDPPFDPVEQAKKRVKREEEQAKIDAEYAKLKPPPPFDPVKEAKKRYDEEQRKKQVEEEYNKLNPKKSNPLLDVTNALRGTIGGIGGPVAGAVLDFGAAIAKSAPPLAMFTVGVTAAVVAVRSLINEIHKAEDQYSPYSPAIASAQAYEEVRRTMGDLRRAQEIGPEMAKYIRSRADLEQKYEDVKVKLLLKIMPTVTRAVEELEKFVSLIGPVMEMVETLSVLTKITDQIRKKLIDEDDDKKELPEDPTSLIFGGDMMMFNTGVGPIGVRRPGVEIPTE